MKRFFSFNSILFVLLAGSFPVFAESPKMIFVENKNQWPGQVQFKADIKGGSVFLEKNTFTYSFMENGALTHEGHDQNDTSKIKFHAFKVNFENSNPDVEVSGINLLQGIRNYYTGNDPKRWAENVKQFAQVHYQGLYPSIDMNVYNVGENLKYDFIIQPGGNTKNIKLNYSGPDGMRIEYGHLYIKTNVGLIIEQKPYAYQEINGVKTEIPCSYELKNNSVTFRVGNYDHLLPLIIDPTLIGSTYTGSTTDNRGYTATYDAAGNMYTGGKVWAQGYPVTVGAWDLTANALAGWDIVISKFSPDAKLLLYSTYYGGTSDQQPHSIIVNSNNELYVAGRTNSVDFPTLNTYGTSVQVTNGGAFDIIVGKFNSTGGLLASTYLGGTADESVNVSVGTVYSDIKTSWGDDGRSEIIIDASSNVYVTANTHSANFPTTAGAYDNTLAGAQDGVVFKMNSSLTTLNFSTYIGGSAYDAAYGLKLDNSNKIYVTGGTTSADFPIPVVVPAVMKPTFGGVADGFIAVFDPSLSGAAQLLRATYLGTASYDQSYLIEIDASNDLYVYGQTAGSYPVTAGVYSFPNSAPTSGMFIHKLRGNLATTDFSTVIGSAGGGINLSPTAFLVDSCQTIYISGWGRCLSTGGQWSVPYQSSTTGLPVTLNAFQSTTDGCDFYFAVLEPDAKSLSYATFFGANASNPDHVDGGTSRFDKRGVIYESVCASCLGTQGFPTTPGAYSSTNNSLDNAQCNNALVKMDVAPNPIAKANIVGLPQGCAPFQVCFNNTGSFASNFIWDFGDGFTSTLQSPCYTYTLSGTYTITLYAIDSIGICGYIDTSMVAITVGQAPVLQTNFVNILCNGGLGSATVTPTGGITPYTYAWTPAGGSTGIASGLTSGNYTVTVTDSTGCVSTNSISVTEPPILTLTTTATGAICGLLNGSATATAGGGSPAYTYLWQPGGNTTANVTGIGSGNYSITVTDKNGCTQIQTVNIPVANGPTVNASATGTITCNGANTGSATATLVGGTAPYTYLWSPSGQTTQTAVGLVSGAYVIIITDAMGCSTQTTVAMPEPALIVPVITNTAVPCFGGNNGVANVNVTGGVPNYTYAWSPSGGNSAWASGLTAGNYSVIVIDANGCTKTATTTITQPASGIAITTTTSGSSCGTSAQGVITSTVTNGTQPYTYNWFPGGQTTPIISNILGGTYTLIVTDANGCIMPNITTLPTNVQPVADFLFIPTISCEGISMQFNDSSSNALTWNWNVPGVGSSTSQNPGFLFPYSGTYLVTLIVTNPPCKDTITKPVVIGDLGSGIVFKAANVFSPNNDSKNDCFFPALINSATGLPDASLMPCTYLEVFDRWGIKMYESIGPTGTNCWNGNNYNDNKPAQDGTYYYISKLGNTTINGFVTLVRHK